MFWFSGTFSNSRRSLSACTLPLSSSTGWALASRSPKQASAAFSAPLPSFLMPAALRKAGRLSNSPETRAKASTWSAPLVFS
ncbi:hypothetical protein D3C85_1661910 [compost metagenome]